MTKASEWISAAVGGITRYVKGTPNGNDTAVFTLTDAEECIRQNQPCSGMLFTSVSGGKMRIPPTAWSWRLQERYQLTGILDCEGTGKGLHRGPDGPRWVNPGEVAMQWPTAEDWDRKWTDPVLVWSEITKRSRCRCGSEEKATSSCGKCGCEVTCGNAHTKQPFESLCLQCSGNTECQICTKPLQNVNKIRCKVCQAIAHPRCALGLWTKEGCPNLACSPPVMHPTASSCAHCHKATFTDTRAQQCEVCMRDRCSEHPARSTPRCKSCVGGCRHKKDAKCNLCRAWWVKTTPTQAKTNALNKQDREQNDDQTC
jgi:hypothetical protein